MARAYLTFSSLDAWLDAHYTQLTQCMPLPRETLKCKEKAEHVGADEEGHGDHYLLAMPHNCIALHAMEWVPKQVPMQEP